jgi:tetratricopeptide (TPR) repeat protein
MSHFDQIALVRSHMKEERYAEAVEVGRSELARQVDSSELLVLMANAVMLGDGNSGTLEEARAWLERAITSDPQNVEARLELGHFLDAVAGEPNEAARVFESAAELSLRQIDDALGGLVSVGDDTTREARGRICDALKSLLAACESGPTLSGADPG